MNVPKFTADLSLYNKSGNRFIAALVNLKIASIVIPALPSCGNCAYIEDACYDCLDGGGSWQTCPTCRLVKWCVRCPP